MVNQHLGDYVLLVPLILSKSKSTGFLYLMSCISILSTEQYLKKLIRALDILPKTPTQENDKKWRKLMNHICKIHVYKPVVPLPSSSHHQDDFTFLVYSGFPT